ncbi:hypothetical protein CFOL_v3_13075 [Cephalotus follicularis]|uniref:Uncharacterized protein n=1 Tax=Cephalotus follicularis TaxID=3775 RepID=A0A1Q3BNX7_CEPFO|nr:hypothetical protein CFOL_v3_13075 [Cephalotus follicularis]
MEQGLKLCDSTRDVLSDPSIYLCLVGCLIYLTVTLVDIVYFVNILSQFMHQPRQPHLNGSHKLLRYLKATQGILLSSKSNPTLHAYCDSNWAVCSMICHSTTEYCILLGFSPTS